MDSRIPAIILDVSLSRAQTTAVGPAASPLTRRQSVK